jgi:outer membrane lipoprotein LolB
VSFSLRHLLPLVMLGVGGCANLPAPQPQAEPAAYRQHLQRLSEINAFSLSGRMAVQTEKRGFSGSLRWKHTEEEDRFALYSPLGAQVAEIISDTGGVTLTTSDRKAYAAEDAETLLQQTMGWSLPLTGLSDWVLGRPAPGTYEMVGWDEKGRLSRLNQDGWQIEFPSYLTQDDTDLPGKILLRSPKLDLKLLVEQWGTLTMVE